MDIEKVVDSIEAVPELLRGFYTEKDGKYHLEDVTSLRNAMQHAKRERDDAKRKAQQIDKWDRLGKSPDEIEQLLEAQRKAEEDRAKKAGEFDSLKAQMVEKHQGELKAREDAVAKMRASLESHLVDASATRAIAEAKGIPALLLPHVKARIKVDEKDGDYVVKVLTADGRDAVKDGGGTPMTIADLIAEFKQSDIFGRAFEGTGRTGSGTPPNGAGGAGSRNLLRSDFEKLDPTDKAARIAQVRKGELRLVDG